MGLKSLFCRTVFFIGWLLSPLTLWNDALINIPLAYLCASLVFRLAHLDFAILMLVFYWLSNLLGLAMMYVSGREVGKEEGYTLKAFLKTLLTIILYSIVLIVLNNVGILKPFPLPVKLK